MVNRQMSERVKFIQEATTKAMMHLALALQSNDIDLFMDKLAQPLNDSDRRVLANYRQMLSMRKTGVSFNDIPCLEIELADGLGNEILWSACCVNVGNDERGPYRMKGGIIVTKMVGDEMELKGLPWLQ